MPPHHTPSQPLQSRGRRPYTSRSTAHRCIGLNFRQNIDCRVPIAIYIPYHRLLSLRSRAAGREKGYIPTPAARTCGLLPRTRGSRSFAVVATSSSQDFLRSLSRCPFSVFRFFFPSFSALSCFRRYHRGEEEEEVEEDRTRVVVAVVVVDSEVVRALWTRWRVRRTGGR